MAKKYWIALIMFFSGIVNFADESRFSNDFSRIKTSMMFEYSVSSNPDKYDEKYRNNIYLDKIENNKMMIETLQKNVQDNKENIRAPYKKYVLNFDNKMIESLELVRYENSEQIKKLEEGKNIKANRNTDFKTKTIKYDLSTKTKEGISSSKINLIYNREPTFISDNFTCDIGIVMRNFSGNGEIKIGTVTNGYYSDANIKYVGEETVDVPIGKIKCRKYEIAGEGLLAAIFGKKAWIWMRNDEDGNYMVKYRNENKFSDYDPIMEFRLANIKKMTKNSWEEFKAKY